MIFSVIANGFTLSVDMSTPVTFVHLCEYYTNLKNKGVFSSNQFVFYCLFLAGFWLVWFLIVFVIGFCVWQRKKFRPWRDQQQYRNRCGLCGPPDLYPDILPSKLWPTS